jgi:P63C domain-containing protein
MQAFVLKKDACMEKDEVVGRARGGVARAKRLTASQRTEISRIAAGARWNVKAEVAKKSGTLKIGDISIPCAVLADGTRVLSERAITKAFGGKRGGSHWKRLKENPDGAKLPIFLSAKNINSFINKELLDGLERRRLYKPRESGGAAHGIEASLLPKICNVLLKVRDANAAHPSQVPIILQADVIMRGLAEIGIIALVDEATGYIDDKKKAEYRDLFREFIRKECREWEKEFPEHFTDMIYRLYGLSKGKPGKHPQFFGNFIRRYVYAPLAGSNGTILKMLDEKNPVVYANGGRRHKLHQFLTEELGLPAIRAHLWQVVGIGNAFRTKENFDRGFRRAFPQVGDQLEMPFDD